MPALLPHFPSSPSRPFTIKKLIMLSARKPYSPHTAGICCTLICSNPSVIPASSVVLSIFTVPFLVLRKLPSSSELRLHFLPLCLRPSGLRVMRIWRFNETFRVKKCFFGCWGSRVLILHADVVLVPPLYSVHLSSNSCRDDIKSPSCCPLF